MRRRALVRDGFSTDDGLLGLLSGSVRRHHDGEPGRRSSHRAAVAAGFRERNTAASGVRQ